MFRRDARKRSAGVTADPTGLPGYKPRNIDRSTRPTTYAKHAAINAKSPGAFCEKYTNAIKNIVTGGFLTAMIKTSFAMTKKVPRPSPIDGDRSGVARSRVGDPEAPVSVPSFDINCFETGSVVPHTQQDVCTSGNSVPHCTHLTVSIGRLVPVAVWSLACKGRSACTY